MPKQAGSWADLKGAYRFFSNPRVDELKIGAPHRAATLSACHGHEVVLCVQDDSDLSAIKIAAEEHLMHHTLAVLPTGRLLGILQQRFFARVKKEEGETRKERAARWRESDIWQESVEAISEPPERTRFIHVADRAADNLSSCMPASAKRPALWSSIMTGVDEARGSCGRRSKVGRFKEDRSDHQGPEGAIKPPAAGSNAVGAIQARFSSKRFVESSRGARRAAVGLCGLSCGGEPAGGGRAGGLDAVTSEAVKHRTSEKVWVLSMPVGD